MNKKNPITQFNSLIMNFPPFHWLSKYKDIISAFVFFLCILGCGYWFYLLIITDVNPQESWKIFPFLRPADSREAMAMLFFGMIALIFIMIILFFIIKLVYNLVWGNIESLFPKEWNSLVRSTALLILIYLSFSFIENIKKIGFATYYQVSEIVEIAKQHKVIIVVDVPVPKNIPQE